MIASRRRPGTTSRNGASRLPARSAAWKASPVTLPPGRARLATKPMPTGSSTSAKTMGTADDACFAASAAFPPVTMTCTLSRANSAASSAERSARPSAQGYWIATVRPVGPAKFVQPLHESRSPRRPGGGASRPQIADGREFRRLLRARRERPRCHAAEQRDELAPPHGAYPKAKDHGLSIAGLAGRGGVHRNKKRRLISASGHLRRIDAQATRTECPLCLQERPNRCIAAKRRDVPLSTICSAAMSTVIRSPRRPGRAAGGGEGKSERI